MSDKRIIAIVMPKWGLSMEEGKVNEWLVEEGARIGVGDEILDVETDKIAGNVEAADAGVLARRLAEPGVVYPVKALLGVLVEGDVSDAEIDAFIAEQQAAFAAAAAEETDDNEPQYRFVDVDGLRLRYAVRGESGDAVVLVHGFGGDLDNWLFNIDALAATHTVYALDLPGHGQSTKRLPRPDIGGLADALVAFMEALDIGSAHLVGHSLGGAIAMQVALAAPARVRSLTLIASAGLGPEIDAEYIAGFVAAASRKELKPWVARLFADQSLVTRQLVDDLLKYKRLDGVGEALAALAASLVVDGCQAEEFAARIDTGRTPTLVLWGAEDRVIPATHAGRLAGAEAQVFDGAGHMVQMEAAGKVNAAIAAHLDRD